MNLFFRSLFVGIIFFVSFNALAMESDEHTKKIMGAKMALLLINVFDVKSQDIALSNDELVYIFNKINLNDLAKCSVVCKRWASCIEKDLKHCKNFKERFTLQSEIFEQVKTVADAWIFAPKLLATMRVSCAELSAKYSYPVSEQYISKLVKCLCKDVWTNKDSYKDICDPTKNVDGQKSIIIRGNVITRADGDMANLNIAPIWPQLALIRAADGFMDVSADELLDELPFMNPLQCNSKFIEAFEQFPQVDLLGIWLSGIVLTDRYMLDQRTQLALFLLVGPQVLLDEHRKLPGSNVNPVLLNESLIRAERKVQKLKIQIEKCRGSATNSKAF